MNRVSRFGSLAQRAEAFIRRREDSTTPETERKRRLQIIPDRHSRRHVRLVLVSRELQHVILPKALQLHLVHTGGRVRPEEGGRVLEHSWRRCCKL